jgi:hypothetical protein
MYDTMNINPGVAIDVNTGIVVSSRDDDGYNSAI